MGSNIDKRSDLMSELKGRTALVTGAGSGIGRAVAVALAERQVDLILVGRNMEKLLGTKELCEGSKVECLSVDLADAEAVEGIFAEDRQFDYLINNAGVTLNKPFEQISLEEYERIMATNVRAPFLLCQRALPVLRESQAPTIINIGSVVSHAGYADQSVYAASKHAILGFSKVLANELYREGIRVHVINPGGVLTDMVTQARPDLPVDAEDLIRPEDIADIICFILEHRCNAIIDEINVHRRKKQPFQI